MAENSEYRRVVVSWLACVVSSLLVIVLIMGWPWLRGASPERSGGILATIASGVLFTAAAIGLTVRDIVLGRMSLRSDQRRAVAKSGCTFLAIPASLVAFFCTCAPLGLLSHAERAVHPKEHSWAEGMWVMAWVLGLVAFIAVASVKHGKGN